MDIGQMSVLSKVTQKGMYIVRLYEVQCSIYPITDGSFSISLYTEQ